MRKSIMTMLLLALAATFNANAGSRFITTTVANGNFAGNTTWYTIQIAANGYVISNNGNASHITLDNVVSDITDEAQLWAFTGDDTNGYRLYNKEAGAGKVLAAPTTMTGTTGSTSYPILVNANAIPSGYTDKWAFTSSTDLGEGSTYFYMYEMGNVNNKVNNRDNILAFWNGGADSGSTLSIRLTEAEYAINTVTGSWTASNTGGTWASAWQSSASPKVTLVQAENKNNMASYNNSNDIQLFTCLANATVNGVYTSTYRITADEGYVIKGYRFKFASSGSSDVTVTPNGGTGVTANSTTAQQVTVSGKDEQSLSFTVSSGSSMFANTSEFYVTIARSTATAKETIEIFTTLQGGTPYRIPAIAKANNGDLIAVADYRHSGADIGVVNYGRIDLLARISNDNGKTWGSKFAIIEGQGSGSPDFMHVGFGDPCIVADRESSRVLLLSCAGNVSFQNGRRNNHQNIARFYSEDNGKTWSAPVDIAESIYSQFDNSSAHGPAMAMFIGSGKIHQSRFVKVNDYYRLYCSVLLKNRNATYTNFVLYSDDFGGSWKVLGGVETAPIPNDADEPKVDELPNGNVIVSSRCDGGRHFNIFTFTNAERAEGYWETRATSNNSVSGIVPLNNSTNGEILVLPATRKEDNRDLWIALHSIPFGSGRNNVGIYYKELASDADYSSPANFAKEWDGRFQVSYLPSAYSTMCVQADNSLGFLYEESTHNADYTIIYKNYTLEEITGGKYSLSNGTEIPEPEPEPDADSYTPAFTGTKTSQHTERWIYSIALTSTAHSGETANSLTVDNSAKKCYNNYTESVTMKAGADEEVTVEVNIGESSWLNAYVYIDKDSDGFTASIENGSNWKPAEDLVTYSFYNNNAASDNNGWNSAGLSITGDSRSTVAQPSFKTPAEAGRYRMRIKTDWCNIDPRGDSDGKFGDFMANGGQIVDFMLEVTEADSETGIAETEAGQKGMTTIHDLQGRKAKTPTKGIYIFDGKKVYVK